MKPIFASLRTKITELGATKYRGAKWHRECGTNLNGIIDDLESSTAETTASLLAALQLCYDHCRLYHPDVERNNVGEVVRAAIAKALGESP